MLDPFDDSWRLATVARDAVELHNPHTGHVVRLGFDAIQEFRAPDVLVLRCQLTLCGNRVIQEPLRWPFPGQWTARPRPGVPGVPSGLMLG